MDNTTKAMAAIPPLAGLVLILLVTCSGPKTPKPVEQVQPQPPSSSTQAASPIMTEPVVVTAPATTTNTPVSSTGSKATSETTSKVNPTAAPIKKAHDAIANYKKFMAEENGAFWKAEYNAYYSTCLRAIVTYKIFYDVIDPPAVDEIDHRALRYHCSLYALRKTVADANQR